MAQIVQHLTENRRLRAYHLHLLIATHSQGFDIGTGRETISECNREEIGKLIKYRGQVYKYTIEKSFLIAHKKKT